MSKNSYLILRISLGITFLWIGILIFSNPEAWGGYLQPWAAKLLILPVKQVLLATAALDGAIGILFLLNYQVRIAALIGALHILIVLITSGINSVTVRDIGLLGAALALFYYKSE